MFARYTDLVQQGLGAVVPWPGLADLNTPLQYHLGWADRDGNPAATPASQGKALRPTLCLFVCEALAGNLARAVPAAAAIELIHNFSLIHDDIHDQDVERRHQPTVWALWGQLKALAAGDAMQCLGDLSILGSDRLEDAPAAALRVSRILTEGCLEMIEGQCLDLGFEARTDITTGEYLHMIACKTGALIRCAVEIGAALADDDPQVTAAFARFGNYLGRAFQIRDDYLGVWGDEVSTGKSTDSDIRRRKKSFPAVFALDRASGAARQDLHRIYAQEELDDSDVARVMTIMDELGASEYANRLTAESADQARQALDGIDLPGWAKDEVEQLVDFLARREF
jgi:geranylgeranyl diphosphate synthase type I